MTYSILHGETVAAAGRHYSRFFIRRKILRHLTAAEYRQRHQNTLHNTGWPKNGTVFLLRRNFIKY